MAYFLFVDESGQDRRESPYEVLAGLAVEDRDLWNLITAVHEAELRLLGARYAGPGREVKGKKFLKRKTFRHAAQMEPFGAVERQALARRCLEQGQQAGRDEVTALAQAKLAFVGEAFDLCSRYHAHAFASIVRRDAPRPVRDVLRKDYAFLFERFFYFLEDRGPAVQGIVVFDELEKAQSHILIDQMEEYFQKTANGRNRSRQIVPQPFFVHSELTTLIQLADLVAYVTAWGFRLDSMADAPSRDELSGLAEQVARLRYQATRERRGGELFKIWSFALIDDLRGWEDRAAPEERKRQ